MSPNDVKMTPGVLGHRDGVVHPAHGDHADRAARSVDQLDRGREHVLNPVPVDGVGVAPAHLHELEVSSPASSVIWATNARAAVGSLYSSTKRIVPYAA
jgi:hypothetical protein